MDKNRGLPSNRDFGLLASFLSAIFTIYMGLKESQGMFILYLIATITLVLITFFEPQMLEPLNRIWYGISVFLGKIANPITLGCLFFLLLTPIALITRLFGRDELKIKRKFQESYWVDRMPSSPKSNSFKNQF